MPTLIPFIKAQWLDSSGDPVAGGKLYSFEAGTSTPLATYTTFAADTENANPTILDSAGRPAGATDIWLSGNTAYKFRLDDANDVTVPGWPIDNIPSSSGGIAVRASASAILACTASAAVLTASSLVPANARLLGVYTENLVVPGASNGLSGYDITSHTIQGRWGTNIGLLLNGKNTIGDFQLSDQPVSASTQDITIIARGGLFDGAGFIEVTAEYETGTAP